jgi:hypothetical protein
MDNLFSNAMTKFKELIQPRFHPVHSNNQQAVYLDTQSGMKVEIDKPPAPLNVQLTDIDSLIQFLGNIGDPKITILPPTPIFIQQDCIEVAIDFHEYNAARVKVPLSINPVFGYISNPITGDPASVVKSLRYNLKSVVTSPDPTKALSVLKFDTQSNSEVTTARGDEGISKSIKSKVTGTDEIPESFEVILEMYPSIAGQIQDRSEVRIDMDIYVNPSAGSVTIRPYPGQSEQAITKAMSMVQDTLIFKLSKSKRPDLAEFVYLGSPD